MNTALLILCLTCFAAALQAQQRSFPVSPGQRLALDLKVGGTISVQGWDRSEVAIAYELGGRHGRDTDIQFRPTAQGVEIVAEYIGRSNSYSNSLQFEIRVPHRFDLKLDSMGGGLHLSDVEGTFTGKTMGGELILDNVRGEARLTTMGGEIRLTNSELDGSLKTMGGKVLFQDVVGDVAGSSMGGNVRYINVRRPDGSLAAPEGTEVEGATGDTVQIFTMGGAIEVEEAPEGASVSTMGGNIHVMDALRFVKAKTMGGDIKIDRVNGWIKATTMGGDIEVTVVGGNSPEGNDIELVSMSGDVTLLLPADFSAELDLQISYTRNSNKNYQIQSAFPVQGEEASEWDYRHGTPRKTISGRAVIGDGKHRVRIETINGYIKLMKR